MVSYAQAKNTSVSPNPPDAVAQSILAGQTRIRSVAGIVAGSFRKIINEDYVTAERDVRQSSSSGELIVKKGEHCSTENGGTVKVLGFSPDQKKVFVTYSAPREAKGSYCPNQTNSWLSVAQVLAMHYAAGDQPIATNTKAPRSFLGIPTPGIVNEILDKYDALTAGLGN